MSTALIIGGGAPNSTLMAGALCAFEEKGLQFDVISASGAGVLIGLFYLAPRNAAPAEALKNTVNFGVDDAIYGMFPVNYKVFHKPGTAADLYRKFLKLFPDIHSFARDPDAPSVHRLFNDWVELTLSTACPTDLSPLSKGMCANIPFLEDVIDFDRLRDISPEFYINAYNITDKKMNIFSKREVTPDHVHASLSFPFIYAPYEIDGKLYYEGASVDALNYKGLIDAHPEVKTIVVFDVLGSKNMIQPPRNLYDAWVKSIIVPLVEIARDDTKIFELKYNKGKNKRKLLKVPFDIPEEHWPDVLDWSYSNLKTLFDAGRESGLRFYDAHEKDLAPLTAG